MKIFTPQLNKLLTKRLVSKRLCIRTLHQDHMKTKHPGNEVEGNKSVFSYTNIFEDPEWIVGNCWQEEGAIFNDFTTSAG